VVTNLLDIELNRRNFIWACENILICAGLSSWPTRAQSVARPPDPKLIEDLVVANRILALQDVVDAYGHVSARHDGDPSRYLLSRSVSPEIVSADDVMEYNLDSDPLDAKGRSSYLERFIHGEIYRTRQDVKAIVHCHTPPLIPFGATGIPLRPMFGLAGFVAEGVPVFDTRKVAGMTDLLVRNATLRRSLAQTLGNKPAALMRGHGAVVVGTSLPQVVGRSVYLAMNARLQMQAMAMGGTVTYLDLEEGRQAAATNDYERAWDLWKRKVMQ
jgi:HCOMODA/2-hydroxy-3-carboxy-muconic semialdehyde decarboxylase